MRWTSILLVYMYLFTYEIIWNYCNAQLNLNNNVYRRVNEGTEIVRRKRLGWVQTDKCKRG